MRVVFPVTGRAPPPPCSPLPWPPREAATSSITTPLSRFSCRPLPASPLPELPSPRSHSAPTRPRRGQPPPLLPGRSRQRHELRLHVAHPREDARNLTDVVVFFDSGGICHHAFLHHLRPPFRLISGEPVAASSVSPHESRSELAGEGLLTAEKHRKRRGLTGVRTEGGRVLFGKNIHAGT